MGICDGSNQPLLVEYSDDPSLAWDSVSHTWNSIVNVTGKLDVSGGDKTAEEKKTFGSAVAGMSSSGLMNVILDVVFENSASSFLEFLTDSWDGTASNTCFFIRWSYNNGASSALRRTAKVALLTNPFTGKDASSGAPVSKELTLVVDGIINRDAVP